MNFRRLSAVACFVLVGSLASGTPVLAATKTTKPANATATTVKAPATTVKATKTTAKTATTKPAGTTKPAATTKTTKGSSGTVTAGTFCKASAAGTTGKNAAGAVLTCKADAKGKYRWTK